jgi:hypothetical protein
MVQEPADAPSNRNMFAFQKPLRTLVYITAMGAVHNARQSVLPAVDAPPPGPSADPCPAHDLLLHQHEQVARDDGLVGVVLQGEYFAPP